MPFLPVYDLVKNVLVQDLFLVWYWYRKIHLGSLCIKRHHMARNFHMPVNTLVRILL